MKLSSKIVLSIVIIVALSVSISGYAIISSGFHAQLDHQIEAVADETQLICAMLGTMTLRDPGEVSEQSTQALLEEALSSDFFRSYSLALVTGESMGDDAVQYSIQKVSEGSFVLTVTARFSVDGQPFFLQNSRDVSAVYAIREQNLQTYRSVFLIAIGVSLLAGFALSALLTAPIRRLSRSTRQIAAGKYSTRAKVHSGDEIGTLAEQFNHMAEELEHHMASLEEAAQRQKDFTASFAHELKTPLTSIIGYADTLRSRRLPEKQQFEAAGFIFSEGKRLETMSHSLLRLFSLDRETPELRPVSAGALAKSVEESVSYPLKQRKLVLELQVEDKTILAESSLLQVLLFNLIDNARKASPPGSKITLMGASVPEGYCFAVKDRGRGIPKEAISRITEPFYMVDKSRSRAEGGAGLGLALCQRIAQLHGSSLQVSSVEGRNTVVAFVVSEAET